jgi:phosphoribosylformylglycinamidine synthase subunit PurS
MSSVVARVYVTLKHGVLDPQGQAVHDALGRLGFPEVSDVRIGKYIELSIEAQAAQDPAALQARLRKMCEGLLANTVIEQFRWELVK